MSIAEADRFISDLKADPHRFDDLEAMKNDPQAVYARVRDLGYDATVEEIGDAFMEYLAEEIGEEELSKIAGGISDGGVIGAVAGGAVAAGIGAGVLTATIVVATSSAAGAAAAI